ncbi:MAG: tRNA (adenosine(37)-N6)-threonylcarbamoyltransferase complex dimerization subunit type 1 TsaB [Gammaproteobacteria bacterium]|nr:tRNA (adenosine(37)-N6)-threonylcarbamoyltransferase complex dimerization subunit type 1 TsaB [Gammaproteobacteria bacterium]
MPNILALDTATDACSVAVSCDGEVRHCLELIPRQHSQRLFSMLGEVLPQGDLRELGIELLAYNHGPGSFTGLRIAASAVQGLAFSNDLPVAGISTLACMAQGAWRRGQIPESATALVVLDARINEIYWGVYELEDGRACCRHADRVAAPDALPVDIAEAATQLVALGSGLRYAQEMPEQLRSRWAMTLPELWPDSLDLLSLGARAYAQGKLCSAEQALPVYLRNEIGWKKLAEQGKQTGD